MELSRAATEVERGSICEALITLIGERGYSETTLEDVLAHAGVNRATFERHFASLDGCFTSVWEAFTQGFVDRALSAYGAAGTWRDGMRAQAWEFCRFLQEDHVRARICMVELAFAGERVQASRDVFMDGYVELVHLGRLERDKGAEISREHAEGIVGAIWERVAAIVLADDLDRLPAEVPQLMYLMVLPYLGPVAAQEELTRGPEDIARYERGEL